MANVKDILKQWYELQQWYRTQYQRFKTPAIKQQLSDRLAESYKHIEYIQGWSAANYVR